MALFYVYLYVDPFTGIPFYVGKGKDYRYRVTFLESKNGHIHNRTGNKIKFLINQGKNPVIIKVKEHLTEQEALDLEKKLIQILGRQDLGTGLLCNHTNGGDGISGHKHTQSTKNKMAIAATGRKLDEETKKENWIG